MKKAKKLSKQYENNQVESHKIFFYIIQFSLNNYGVHYTVQIRRAIYRKI